MTRVRIYPRPGKASEMIRGRFVGSITSPTNDFEELAEIKDAPPEGQWTEITVPRGKVRAYRFLKYQARNGVHADLGELEFYAGDRKLVGTPFGTSGSGAEAGDPRRAFDGDTSTSFRGEGTFGQYVGIDLGSESQAASPVPSIKQGSYDVGQTVTLTSETPGARIIYSLDSWARPSLDESSKPAHGALGYDGHPITVAKSVILQAIATKPGLADSPPTVVAYRIGKATDQGPETAEFHIGNSLTDTVNPWMEPLAASGGRAIRYYRFAIPGAPTDWLWNHPGSGFGETNYAQAFVARAPLSDLITQPFAGHGRSVDNEAEYSGKFFDLARKDSPRVRMWLYVQWPDLKWDRDPWASGRTEEGGKPVRFAEPAKTYEQAVANHALYTERVMALMNKARASEIREGQCQPVRIIPGGLALARLKSEMEAKRVPGLDDFISTVFASPTDFHMSRQGSYLIALVHYACLYGENPEGKVTASGSNLTPDQARIFQRIAWETARDYPHSGLTKSK